MTAAGTRTIAFTFVDGDGTVNGGVDTATASVAVEVLPAPGIDPGAVASGVEDGASVALTGVVIDVVLDDPANDVITVRLGVDHGTLTIDTGVAGGITAGDVVGNDSGFLVITGTQDAINATLAAANGLVYLADPDFAGTDALAIQASTSTTAGTIDFMLVGGEDADEPVPRLDMHDLDGDGTSELVIGTQNLVVVFGTTNAFFPLSGSGFATAFAFGDYDGDGLDDIAIAVGGAGNGYLAVASMATGVVTELADIDFAFDVVTADFDGDGRADLAVTDGASGTVGVLLQTAPGSFAAPAFTTPTTSLVGFLATGDFNGDGDLDLLVSNIGEMPGPALPGSIDLLLGNGDGTFQAPAEVLSADASSGEIVAADFDGDGRLDFAYASSRPGTGTNGVVVVLGSGDGTFAAPVGYETTPDGGPAQLVAADLDGDGVLDLAVANFNAPGSFSVLLGKGDGSFAAPVEVGTFDTPFSIAAGDPDGDGDIDLVTGSIDGLIEFYNNFVDEPSRSATASKAILITGVNDAPVLTVQDVAVSGTEDTNLVFNAAGSNAITVADVDDASLTVTLT
ncbi:MAG TPA: VCBS repeat-containing protein, partial [Agromyces sp.]